MTTTASIAPDILAFDGGLSVVLTQNRGGVAQQPKIRNVIQGPLTNRQINALGGIALTGKERNFSLNSVDVGKYGVEQGDIIDDGTNKWSVLMAELLTLGSRWRCAARMMPV
jgi:hypothetical protein